MPYQGWKYRTYPLFRALPAAACTLHVSDSVFKFCFVLFCFVGSTLTPLTPISVSDVNKSLLSNSISILGDNAQFQTGTVA